MMVAAPGPQWLGFGHESDPQADRSFCQKAESKMPRDIPVGNGRLLVTFDHQYQLRDLYFPHVGQENHAGAGPCRFGVYTDIPGRYRSRLFWTSDEGWTI